MGGTTTTKPGPKRRRPKKTKTMRIKKQHTEDCFCWKCFCAEIKEAIDGGRMIEDKKGRLFGTDPEGLEAYRKANPEDFQLTP
jgi:hypothetical protein